MTSAPSSALPQNAALPALTPATRLSLSLIAGGAVANIYYNQPLLAVLAQDLGAAASSLVPTATLAGYGLGILGLVPMGDRYPRRGLIVGQLLLLSGALVLAALAPGLGTLAAASFLIGVLSTAAQQAVPFAAELAPDASRGRMVGQVMTGLLLGILLARTLSGLVGAWFGWRAMFGAACGLSLALAALAALTLPATRAATRLPYGALMASVLDLARGQAPLRRAALSQALLFAAFNAFWTSLALFVEGPPFRLDPAGAGLFGLIGAAGALCAPYAGRFADAKSPRPVVIGGALLTLASFAVFGLLGGRSLAAMALGVLLIDIGINTALIANQTRVYALAAGARGRINTVFFTAVFIGGALGASAGTRAFAAGGWPLLCLVGGAFAAAGVVVPLLEPRAGPRGA
ncbi:major facilitator superfamily MFS_1 [Methylobacterium sp. 4-46]|uniref:MFS transporter n=1 Tax=unclassified Methylobacterium TaxID=2615210 RepID=UPI000152E094|nr:MULTISPECIES: MFS transporter [Methylobacterium]ACA20304.1 major facilitator superfamily MFS_1 [Methylobacterium sp. 4-46]WFT79478.1 MFS transporter [Methylobacterium nodulans]